LNIKILNEVFLFSLAAVLSRGNTAELTTDCEIGVQMCNDHENQSFKNAT